MRPAVLALLPTLNLRSIGFKLSDYLTLIRKADRAGTTVREYLRVGGTQIVVVGSDAHRECIAYYLRWAELLPMLARHPPDLLIAPELGIYEVDRPIVRYLHHFAAQRMYADLADRGIAALPTVGWRMQSDLDLMAEWIRRYEIRGCYIEAQGWHRRGLDEMTDDLTGARALFPPTFVWMINGTLRLDVWRQLRTALGTVRITSTGLFHQSRNGKMYSYGGGDRLACLRTHSPWQASLAESLHALTTAGDEILGTRRERFRVVRIPIARPKPLPQSHSRFNAVKLASKVRMPKRVR